MESSNGYTDERCYRIRYIVAEGLRELFKQEWDTLYKSTIGEWKDEPRNGKDFYIKESPRNQERNAHLLATMKNGNRAEWDCTMLFYAILFSDCVGTHLNAKARKIVDDLRKFMNEEFAHMLQGSLSEIDFQNAFSKIDVAFEALRLSTVKIHDFKYQMFHLNLTEVLKEVTNHLKRQLQAITCQRQVLEDKVQKEAPSFCILPPKPLHVISNRDREVEEILQQLKELKECSGNRLSCFHISGNPGSGKSQLAGLVAERFYDEVIEMPGGSSFVMTLNAANPDSLLESYASFARHLNYPDHSVMQILRTNGSVEAKIAHLEFLIATKIGCYTSWLLVVDNVTTMSTEHVHLPHFGAEAWARGQLLITTQDTTSLPLQSPFIKHISVNQGMEPTDARSLLAKLSGVADSELGTIIAQTLDYQPLALAGAAVFVGNIRQDKAFRHFGWKEYLTILEKEKWDNTEDTLVNTNSLYPNTMAKAVTLAVKFVMRSDGCVKQLFTFLSLCAPQPLNVDIAINYIMNLHEDFDEADRELILKMLMRCPLLLVEEKDGGHFIRAHQLVHDAIRIVLYESHERQNLNVVIGIVNSFHQFILALPRVNRRLHTIHIVPHVHAFSMSIPKVSDILSHDKLQVARALLKLQEQGATLVDVANTYRNLAMMHLNLGDCEQAKKYQHVALAINVGRLGVSQFSVATLYFELASMYKESGYLEEAKEYNQRARRIVSVKLEQVVPQDLDALEQPEKYHHALNTQICAEHLSVATGYSNLSLIRQDLGDLEQAKEFQQSSLAIPLKTFGAEHASVATSYSNLASIHQDLRDPEQAKEYQQRALAIKLKKLGADHVSVATSYSNLALIHHELGDLEKAKAYQQRAVAIQLKKLGGEHLSVATSYSNLALIHHDLGDLEMAKAYQQRALGIQLKTLGAEHLAVATSCSNLASIHQDLGDLEQAKEYQQRALAIKLKKLGAEHLSVATSYSNLASIHWDLGDLEQAREYQQRSLAIKLKRLGAEHLSVAVGYSNLALIHQEICDLEQANGYKQRTLHKERKELGAEHFSVARSFGNFSLTHTDLADLEKAREYQERAIAIDRKNLSAEHASVATSYSNLALVHKDLDSDDFRQSKEYQQRAPVVEFKERNSGNASEATNYKHPRSRNGLCFCLLL